MRMRAVFVELAQHDSQEIIAVFPSATPIVIAAGAVLQLTAEKSPD